MIIIASCLSTLLSIINLHHYLSSRLSSLQMLIRLSRLILEFSCRQQDDRQWGIFSPGLLSHSLSVWGLFALLTLLTASLQPVKLLALIDKLWMETFQPDYPAKCREGLGEAAAIMESQTISGVGRRWLEPWWSCLSFIFCFILSRW